ncbi:DNA-methyltransferase [Nocardia sp. NPDC058499]|uniref:DNA-methyltransferase n=1 Tax=Nocardia sp. NPDC058499 TaxID=3346530 RepID=UPI00364A9592
MKPHYRDKAVTVYAGDCLELLREMPADSIDAVVTDPPFGLNFMGAEWDSFRVASPQVRVCKRGLTDPAQRGSTATAPTADTAGEPFQEWSQTWATECLRLLKPGGHLVAFGGTRTWHRLATGIECAGFDLRDSIAWLYGSGFPKSLDVPQAIQHHRQKTRGQPVRDSDIDAEQQWEGWGTALKPGFQPIVLARKPLAGTVAHNVFMYGTGALNIDGCRIDGRERIDYGLANAKRTRVSTYGVPSSSADFDATKGRWPANVVLDEAVSAALTTSRYFYTARAGSSERPQVHGVRHPTVKPIALMRWLVRLVTPPTGLVLDPFAGSGTTAEACALEGKRCIAIEREATYLPLILARLVKPKPVMPPAPGASL